MDDGVAVLPAVEAILKRVAMGDAHSVHFRPNGAFFIASYSVGASVKIKARLYFAHRQREELIMSLLVPLAGEKE